jgi:hypothetical protein
MFCPQCGAQYPDDVTKCSACYVSLVSYLDLSESLSNPIYLTKVGRIEGLITLIFTSVSSWITAIKMRRKVREKLGRKATDTDLASIDTWTRLDEVEERDQENKPLG